MDRNKKTLQIFAKQDKFYKSNIGWLFPDEQKKSGLWDSHQEDMDEMFEEDDPIMADDNLIDFAEWHLGYAQYAWAKLDDKDLQQHEFSRGIWCAYHSVKIRAEMGRIEQRINSPYSSGKLMYWWSNLILAGWVSEADEIMKLALASTNESDNHGIMSEGGYSFDTFSFFLMELYCLWKKKSFDRKDFDHPLNDGLNTPFIYDAVLPYWNTKNLEKIDQMVSLMADYHLIRTTEQDEDTTEEDEDHFEFSDSNYRLYPFEILVWLKIRSLCGLTNPTTYSHPLMNQPLAEPISDKPLPRPTDHKETNQLLALVRKHYPDARL